MNTIKKIQTLLGVVADGIWGPKSQAALISASDATKKSIQMILKVVPDGIWGPLSQAALNAAAHGTEDATPPGSWFSCEASSFADPADVRAFERCKATGKSDLACFAVGDNGIGQFGKITAQDRVPMIAVHKTDMIARWGSVQGAAHRPVQVTVRGVTIDATVEERISAPGRIDLNPSCAKQLGLNPPFVVRCKWRWA